jgi:hypothetical protein
MKLRNLIFTFFMLSILAGCVEEERPNYSVVENDLPSGGPVIDVRDGKMAQSIREIEKYVGAEKFRKFNKSLSWYATESMFDMENIAGKNARELVQTVNCLKYTAPAKQEECFK